LETVLTPQRIESSLLVVEPFKDASGYEWQAGDRASLARAAVRRAASERPQLFRVEYATEELDPSASWFQAVVEEYEARYAEAKRLRDGAEERRQKALHEELKEQEKGQPALEKRYREQERQREQRAQRVRARIEREKVERELELGLEPLRTHG
jgi:hypothetical protein